MIKTIQNLSILCICTCTSISGIYAIDPSNKADYDLLRTTYESHCKQDSNVKEHIPILRDLARDCSSAVEIGIKNLVSSWGILLGLAEGSEYRTYLGIDLASPPMGSLNLARQLSESHGVFYTFLQTNDMEVILPTSDMLFIDSLHTYCHLMYELEAFSPEIRKFIVIHYTSGPWENCDDREYKGDYSEYPEDYNRNKKGLWPAIEDFLACHPEWKLQERRFNCYGLTILKRIAN